MDSFFCVFLGFSVFLLFQINKHVCMYVYIYIYIYIYIYYHVVAARVQEEVAELKARRARPHDAVVATAFEATITVGYTFAKSPFTKPPFGSPRSGERKSQKCVARSKMCCLRRSSRDRLGATITMGVLRGEKHIGLSTFGASNRGLECCFHCWTAGQGLAQKGAFSQTPRRTLLCS